LLYTTPARLKMLNLDKMQKVPAILALGGIDDLFILAELHGVLHL
jgi:hypothetical protein